MPRTLRDLRQRKLGAATYEEMFDYLKAHKPVLWGTLQPPSFLEANLVLALYKDLVHHGYQRVLSEVKLTEFILSDKSFIKNTRRIRAVLAGWAEEKMKLGTRRDWNAAARHARRVGQLTGVNLA